MSDAAVQKERVSAEQVGVVRGVAIAEVLGTDMKKHFDITSRFQVKPLAPYLLPLCDYTRRPVTALSAHD